MRCTLFPRDARNDLRANGGPAHLSRSPIGLTRAAVSMPATNAVLHDSRYRADGIFCEPPKKLDPAVVDVEDGKEQASQSRWNTNDYHWEERDIIEFARKEVAASLVDDESARVVWQDKNGGDLVIVSATLEGDAASNVRKGKRILTYSLTLTVKCEGQRNGARLNATLSTDEFCHDDETPDFLGLVSRRELAALLRHSTGAQKGDSSALHLERGATTHVSRETHPLFERP